GVLAIILKSTGTLVPGWASLIVAITFVGGIQLFTLGVMGEYLSRIHEEVRARPLYLIRDAHGVDQGSGESPARSAVEDKTPQESPRETPDPAEVLGR
ncbi:MAG TPA: hypothetical protein VNP90_07880, partial [Actinomycetota bacterium]|nr:hypothetical protein [Actinomycetota bacterium]